MHQTHEKKRMTTNHGPVWIPILPRHDVAVFCLAGNGHRFAELFRQTWKQMPLSPRRMLLKMWRQRRPTGCDLPWPPIEMLAGKSDFSRGNSSAAIAQYTTWMLGFAFDSRYMDRLSDESVKSVIAHELAHAVLITQDAEGHLSEAAYDESGFSQAEYDADELAGFWGFDEEVRTAEIAALSAVIPDGVESFRK